MKTSILLPALLLPLITVYPSVGLYFHIRETEEKCFIEEVPDETMVVGTLYRKNAFRCGSKVPTTDYNLFAHLNEL